MRSFSWFPFRLGVDQDGPDTVWIRSAIQATDRVDEIGLFLGKSVLLTELSQPSIAGHGCGCRGPAHFRMAFRAQIQWMAIRFFSMIRPTHVALIRGTVRNREHVPRFMSGRLERPSQTKSKRGCVA